MKHNFKFDSIFKNRQISLRFLLLMIVLSNILWFGLFYISFNKLNHRSSDDISTNDYVGMSGNLDMYKKLDEKEIMLDTESVNTGNLFDNAFNDTGIIDVNTGKDVNADGYKRTVAFYPFKKGNLYFVSDKTANPLVILFYNENKDYLGYQSFNNQTYGQYAVTEDGYFRMYTTTNFDGNIYFSTNVPNNPIDYTYIITNEIKANCEKRIIVNFGDSIIGNTQDYTSVSAQLEKMRNDIVYNCGFGGCRMSVHKDGWDKCSMYRIADYIYDDNFTDLVNATQNGGWNGMPTYFDETAELLNRIDFADVDVITISYGTNDYREETSILDNKNNRFDTTTVCGALRYSIKQIQSKYPNIKILVTTPIFRTFLDADNDYAVIYNSDTKNWGSGTLLEYADAIKNACKEMKVPCLDLQNESQLNEFTRLYFYPVDDGTHPNEEGRELIAHLINGKLQTILN